MSKPSDMTIKAWVRLLRAHEKAVSSVELALKAAGLPPLAWYDVLLELERSGDDGMRPFELERELLLPQYGVSRLIERIEKAGYLKRSICADDKRGQRIAITNTGKQLRQKMWGIYAPAIDRAVGKKLTQAQVAELSKLLSELI